MKTGKVYDLLYDFGDLGTIESSDISKLIAEEVDDGLIIDLTAAARE